VFAVDNECRDMAHQVNLLRDIPTCGEPHTAVPPAQTKSVILS
jgi:hypothetical protein